MSTEPVNAEPSTTPLTVVVATRDRAGHLCEALAALGASLRDGDSIIVVDSASSDPRVGQVALAAGARLVRCDRPGACRARNAGWRASETEVVAFTDDDCRPRPGWARALARAAALPARPDFVTGKVMGGQEGRAQLTLSVTSSDEPATFAAGDDTSSMGHGANMAWRRSALERIDGFDEALGPGAPLLAAEDHDAFWRCLRDGGTGRFDPRAVVEHRQWRDRAGQLQAYFGYGVGSGALAVKQWRMGALTRPVDAREPAGSSKQGGSTGTEVASPLPAGTAVRRAGTELAWARGAVPVARNLAAGYEMGAVAEAVKLAGSIVGVRRARRMALVGGHFSPLPR